MNDQILSHPPRERLLAYGLGKLDPDEASDIESHVADCDVCGQMLINLQDDTFVNLVRRADAAELQSNNEAQGPNVSSTIGVAASQSADDTELPAALKDHPRYRIIELLGHGGMGDVYLAEHKVMNRPVALKVINRALVDNPQAAERFRREVHAAARLSHAHIVTAHDAEQAGDSHFLVMEFVDGIDLACLVKDRGALPVAEASDYVRQAAIGLQYAHDRGMIHRDIKPHNLMVSADGAVKILDFGLASLTPTEIAGDETANLSGELTAAGSIMGTPDYISPEQADDASQADIRSDIYSLGITLYFLLSGRPPFAEGSVMHKLKSHAQAEPEPIESLRDDMPLGLVQVLKRMLAKDPAERFQTPSQVADALEPFTGPRKLAAVPAEVPVKAPRRSSRQLASVAMALLVLVGLGFVVAALMGDLFGGDSKETAKVAALKGDGPEDNEPKQSFEPPPPTILDDKPVLIRRFVGHQGPVWEVVISRSGRWAASVSGGGGSNGPSVKCDGMVRIWDFSTGKMLHEWKGPSEDMRGLAFSPNEKYLLTAARHGNGGRHMQLWDPETRQEIRQFSGGYHSLNRLIFIDDERACSVCNDKTAVVWDIRSGTALAHFPQPFGVVCVDTHTATSRMAVGQYGAVCIIDLRDGSEVRTIHLRENRGFPPNALSVEFSPDGRRLAVGVFMQGTLIWDIDSGKLLHEVPLGSEAVKWTGDGRYVIGGKDGHWFIYDTQDKQTVSRIELTLRVYSIALAPDGRSVLLGGGPRWHFPDDRDFALQHWRLPKQLWPKSPNP